MAIDPLGNVPYNMANMVANDKATWQAVRIRYFGLLNVCWCGSKQGCVVGSDFNIHALTIKTIGPYTHPPQKQNLTEALG